MLFDKCGIPHIYADKEEDAMRVLGWCHAQDRLFQMEMLKRVGGARLAEILGKDFLPVDKFFLTMGVPQHAKLSAEKFFADKNNPVVKMSLAYIDGINQYIENGKTPIEFTLMGIKKEKFTPEDLYQIAGYMSFSFVEAFKEDPVLNRLVQNHGMKYLDDLTMPNQDLQQGGVAKNNRAASPFLSGSDGVGLLISEIQNKLPFPVFVGSNSLVLSGSKTQNGKVIFENDTHIGYAQPSVWYEAHIDCPTLKLYGNYLAGIPFPLVAHNDYCAYGVTMFENDDVDFFNEENKNVDSIQTEKYIVKVKGEKDFEFVRRVSKHGPIISDVKKDVMVDSSTNVSPDGRHLGENVSVFWTYTQEPTNNMQVFYDLCHCNKMDEARNAASMIIAPGLNIIYGDRDGNIAHWAAAKLYKRQDGAIANLFQADSINYSLDNSYSFDDNPQEENPKVGYVLTANQEQQLRDESFYPGYYAPDDRVNTIEFLLGKEENKITAEAIKKIFIEQKNNIAEDLITYLQKFIFVPAPDAINVKIQKEASSAFWKWNKLFQSEEVGPTIYYKLIYNILQMTMEDELGRRDFKTILNTHFIKAHYPSLIKNDSSIWWDNINTTAIETKDDILKNSWKKTIDELTEQLGSDVSKWTWGKVHVLVLPHPIGKMKPFDKIFNVGPYPAPGGIETINNISFNLDSSGYYPSTFGPQMRIVIDFADLEHAWSINPSGQSGYFMSQHYFDQTQMYLKGEYRMMLMNRKDIEAEKTGELIFTSN